MKPKIKKLKNGLQIVTIPTDAPTVTALVLVGTGSSFEREKEGGLSHFLEHMCFKGTEKYTSAKVITETLESLGAISNAFTSHEYTGYYVKGNPKHLPTFISVLGEIYLKSTFPETEIQKEKGVIIEEIRMYEDMHHFKVVEQLMSLMYPNHSAGRPILGTPESVTSFTRNDFIKYRQQHYHASNTIIVVCGGIENGVAKDIEKIFKGIDEQKSTGKKKTTNSQKGFASRILRKEIGQGHIAIGFHSVPYRHEDSAAIKLLATILGRGMSSRLFLLLREELGVAYEVRTEQDSFSDHGVFAITAGIDKARINEIIAHIARELKRIKDEEVGAVELAKAKEFSIGMLRLGMEGTDDIANFIGTQLVLKKEVKSIEEVVKEYMKVTPKDIQRVAKKILKGEKGNIAIIGPYKTEEIDVLPLAQLV